MSWKIEVITDSTGKWTSNAVRFATRAEAHLYVLDLGLRWTAVREARLVESEDPINYAWVDGRLVPIEGER